MKKNIALPIIVILAIGLIFVIAESLNFTTFTNLGQKEVIVVDSTQIDDDSCAYYLNRAVEFTVDTLEGMKNYKKQKEQELVECYQENIELIKQLESKKDITSNWRVKYKEMENKFKEAEKENFHLISENYKLKNANPIEYKVFEPSYEIGRENDIMYFSDSIIYDEKNKTYVELKVPYLVNYYKDNKHIEAPEGVYAEIVYTKPKIKVHQDVAIQNVITEENDQLVTRATTSHPNVTIHNEETILDIGKKRIKQLVRKIDPDAKVLDVK